MGATVFEALAKLLAKALYQTAGVLLSRECTGESLPYLGKAQSDCFSVAVQPRSASAELAAASTSTIATTSKSGDGGGRSSRCCCSSGGAPNDGFFCGMLLTMDNIK